MPLPDPAVHKSKISPVFPDVGLMQDRHVVPEMPEFERLPFFMRTTIASRLSQAKPLPRPHSRVPADAADDTAEPAEIPAFPRNLS